jgi:sugar/nucleoside kinase (ribokinase family)
MAPDILILGQITVDDTAPSEPGAWQRQLGGNALYSVSGARLWCASERIGMVARVAANLPFDVASILRDAGLSTDGLTVVAEDALIEWILYEEDGNRQSLPRNYALRDPSADLQTLYARYLLHIANLSASHEDIPPAWLPAKAIHLAPQVQERHEVSCRILANKTKFLSVDPSPHYSRGKNAADLHDILRGATAFLPSQAEIEHMSISHAAWSAAVLDLCRQGFKEVLMKRGSAGCLLVDQEHNAAKVLGAAQSIPRDFTGAGDAFSGAYATCRALGHTPREAAERAVVTAAMVIECSGTEEAFALDPRRAEERLTEYQKLT